MIMMFFVNTISSLSSLNCLSYQNDREILLNLGFPVPMYADSLKLDMTNAELDYNGQVTELRIHNEKYIPLDVFCLKHLTRLEILNSSFHRTQPTDKSMFTIPSEISQLAPTLRVLVVDKTPISYLPKELYNLTRLISLSIRHAGLKTISDDIQRLTLLESLEVKDNELTSLPFAFRQLNRLGTLDVSSNPIQSLNSVEGMNSLRFFWATKCQLKEIPRNLPSIQFFMFGLNKIENLDGISTIGTNTLERKTFDFKKNQIKVIPKEIRQVKNVESLNLSYNQLQDLPDEIYDVQGLTMLAIYANLIIEEKRQVIEARFKISHPQLTII